MIMSIPEGAAAIMAEIMVSPEKVLFTVSFRFPLSSLPIDPKAELANIDTDIVWTKKKFNFLFYSMGPENKEFPTFSDQKFFYSLKSRSN